MAATVLSGDVLAMLKTLPDASVHCCVTSPPYWGLRDYGHDGQIGLESTPEAYVARMVEVFREVRRVLREDGTLWLNLGDSYAGSGPSGASYQSETTKRRAAGDGTEGVFRISKTLADRGLTYAEKKPVPPPGLKAKDLVGIPWRVAFALQADGWWLRQDIIWAKPNPMPESVRDRCTKAHEYVFLLTKSERYYYDAEAVSEAVASSSVSRLQQPTLPEQAGSLRVPGKTNGPMKAVGGTGTRNRRSVWTVTTKPYSGAHFATMPPDLVEPCVKAGCPEECCAKCGAGHVRITERKRTPTRPGDDTKVTGDKMTDGNRDPQRHVTTTTTVGWKPACKCGVEDTKPGVVLDPFAGSGTTLAVATMLGRDSVGCELNPEYVKLAERRIAEAREKVAVFDAAR